MTVYIILKGQVAYLLGEDSAAPTGYKIIRVLPTREELEATIREYGESVNVIKDYETAKAVLNEKVAEEFFGNNMKYILIGAGVVALILLLRR